MCGGGYKRRLYPGTRRPPAAWSDGGMEIRELRAFAAVAEDGSLSAAARRLHLSQSALSQTVQSLERELGVRLLDRGPSGARPTEAGQVLLREARSLIDQHDRAVALIAGPAAPAAVLRVGVPLEFPADVLPGAFARLAISHPQTRVEIGHAASAAQLSALRAGDLDLALVREQPPDPVLDAVLAVEEPMGVLVSDARAAGIAEPGGLRLDKLAGLTWIGFPRSDSPAWYDQVAATMRVHGIEISEQPPGDPPVTTEVKLAAVGSGRMFALAPPLWPQPLPSGIGWHPLIGSPVVRRTWAVWEADSRRRDLAALVAMIDINSPG
jgi:DNA-binding transcriptional LysR family regulator